MYKKYILAIVALLFLAVPYAVNAQIYFGGTVTATIPCNSGMLLYVLQPMSGMTTLMWPAGELPYLMFTPPHPGQNIVGQDAPVSVPCFVGITQVGSGFPILYHGSGN